MSRAERRAMVERDRPALSLSRQCRLLSIGRSSLCYTPKGETAETLALMRRIDDLFLKYPFYGARQMVRHLRREGVRIGRRRAARLMRLLGLQAVWRAPRTSDRHPGTGCGPIRSRACGSSGRTTSGAPTSPTSRCSAASSTWWRSWTGRAATSWPGGCRTRWMRVDQDQERHRLLLQRVDDVAVVDDVDVGTGGSGAAARHGEQMGAAEEEFDPVVVEAPAEPMPDEVRGHRVEDAA